MIYYGIRIALAIVVFVIVPFILLKKGVIKKPIKVNKGLTKQRLKNDVRFKKKLYIKRFIIIAVSLLMVIVFFFPIEGYFIRFNSLDACLQYSLLNNFTLTHNVIESDDTVFIVSSGSNNETHSTVLYEDGYGLCDFKTQREIYSLPKSIDNPQFLGTVSLSFIYSEVTDKTCYFGHFGGIRCNPEKVFDKDGNTLDTIIYDNKSFVFYEISDGQPQKGYSVFLGDTKVEMIK